MDSGTERRVLTLIFVLSLLLSLIGRVDCYRPSVLSGGGGHGENRTHDVMSHPREHGLLENCIVIKASYLKHKTYDKNK